MDGKLRRWQVRVTGLVLFVFNATGILQGGDRKQPKESGRDGQYSLQTRRKGAFRFNGGTPGMMASNEQFPAALGGKERRDGGMIGGGGGGGMG